MANDITDTDPVRQGEADDTRRDDVLCRMLNTPRKPKAIETVRDQANEAAGRVKASPAQIGKERKL